MDEVLILTQILFGLAILEGCILLPELQVRFQLEKVPVLPGTSLLQPQKSQRKYDVIERLHPARIVERTRVHLLLCLPVNLALVLRMLQFQERTRLAADRPPAIPAHSLPVHGVVASETNRFCVRVRSPEERTLLQDLLACLDVLLSYKKPLRKDGNKLESFDFALYS